MAARIAMPAPRQAADESVPVVADSLDVVHGVNLLATGSCHGRRLPVKAPVKARKSHA